MRIESLACVALALFAAACGGRGAGDIPVFTDSLAVAAPRVRDQGESDLCWMYAMLTTIEADRLAVGDSVALSADYPVRRWIEERLPYGYLSRGATPLSLRGMGVTALALIERYGLVPEDACHRRPPYGDYAAIARGVERVARMSRTVAEMRQRTARWLDEAICPLPRRVYMLGAEYTPREFAHSVARPGGYRALTSYTHHPWGERFPLELADNVLAGEFLNVPPDTLLARVDRALAAGHAVCWEGDITEPGFDDGRGVARLGYTPSGNIAARRQRDLESGATTDDHCMAILGTSRDESGRLYYIAQNSWGTDSPARGRIRLSREYLMMKTVAVYLLVE